MTHGKATQARTLGGVISVVAVSALVNILALRGIWFQAEALPNQFWQGYFELHDGVVGLTLDEQQQDRFLPNLSLTDDRKIDLPPGTSVGVALESGTTYEISAGELGIAPYAVFGRIAAIPSGRPGNAEGEPPFRLVETLSLDLADGALVLRPWDASLPYQEDKQRLRAVQESCVGDATEAALLVERSGERLSVVLEGCALETTIAPGSGDPYVMAVVAGLQWHSVAPQHVGFRVRRDFHSDTLRYVALFAVAVACLLALTPWVGTPLATSILLGVASLFLSRILSAALLISIGIAALVLAPISLTIRWVGANRPTARLGLITVSYGLILITGLWALTGTVEPEAPPVDERKIATIGHQPSCILTGYSTADDVQVREESPGTWRYLAESCGACPGGARKYALTSKTFPWMRSFACSPISSLVAGESVVFLGASNDDFSSWAEGRTSPWSIVARNPYIVTSLYYLLRDPSSTRLRSGIDHRAQLSAENLGAQQHSVGEAVRCTTERGASFLYAHDFLILDIEGSRSPSRLQMLQARRDSVTQAGGEFVDLLSVFGDVVGVSWFNDMIHLSSVGHLHVAEHICKELGGHTR